MKRLLALLILLLAASFALPASAAPLSGTRSIGPTGDYASITAAIADIQAQTLDGALVLELQPAYVSTVETFPLVFTNLTTTATNTLTLRPQIGATLLSITSADTTAATVDLNGAQFLTLDGRPGGTGTTKQLTIANTSTSGVALRFINEASTNTIEYLTLQGVNTDIKSGTVVFGTTTGANGNDNNTIDHCDIRDGASTPSNALFSSGSIGTTAKYNSGNTVSSCNVFNFYSASGFSSGVLLNGGCIDWTITGNSFYQTASRAIGGFMVNPILINTGDNITITGNFIGGSAPNAGGSPWTTTGTTAVARFIGIELIVGNTMPSNVHGNSIRNFIWTGSSSGTTLGNGPWTGIYLQAGSANIGTTTGNTIGSGTGTGFIAVTTSGNGGTTFGIGSTSGGTVAIANNTIGSITISGTSTAVSASLVGIQVTAGAANTIANNTVGSTTTANSLNAVTSSIENTAGQQVTGILISGGTQASVSGNTVANLNNNYAGTASNGQIRGIATTAGVNTVTGNTVRNLSTTSAYTGLGASSSVRGISQSSTTAGQTVSQNVVHSLASTAASQEVSVIGIYYGGSTTTGPNVIARNLVHSLSVASSHSASQLHGITLGSGTFTVQNNVVCVGLDANGASAAEASNVRGIYDSTSTAGRNFYHNSVYVGGVQTSGTSSTMAFDSIAVSNTRVFENNVFVNARGKSGTASGNNYAAVYGGTGANPAGLAASNNIFFASGTGGVLGRYKSLDQVTLAAWQTATGVDAASLNADPLYVNPIGAAATVDLHIQNTSPARGAAAPIAAVTNDFDGDMRSVTTPDIGADEFLLPNNANLFALSLSIGTLSPAFAAGTTLYTVAVSNGTKALTLTPVQTSGHATVTVNGASADTPVTLNLGTNTITINVTAQDGTMKPYTVIVTRQTGFQIWAAANGISSDPSATGGNGLANLLNYGFGMNPHGTASFPLIYTGTFAGGGRLDLVGLPIMGIEGADARALFVRRTDLSTAGLSYVVEFSGDLSGWQASSDTPTVLADGDPYQLVSVPFPTGLSSGGFFRVRLGTP